MLPVYDPLDDSNLADVNLSMESRKVNSLYHVIILNTPKKAVKIWFR